MFLNCGFGEDSWEFLGLPGDQTSQSWRRSTLNIHWKDWCCSWGSNTLATWCKELTHWKRPWCWERLRAGGEGDDRGKDSWMASPTQWAWVWASSRKWWLTRKTGVLQSMGSQRVWHLSNWTTMSGCPMVIVYTRMTGPATHLSLASELFHHQTSSYRKCTVLGQLSIKGGRGGRIWDPSEPIRLFWKFELWGK